MDPRLFDPSQWADSDGAILFYAILGLIALGTLLKLVTAAWPDWLDDRSGRGSVRDSWPHSPKL